MSAFLCRRSIVGALMSACRRSFVSALTSALFCRALFCRGALIMSTCVSDVPWLHTLLSILDGTAYFKGFQVVGHLGGKKNRGAEGWTLGRRKFQSFSNIGLNM